MRICVFSGSCLGIRSSYKDAAIRLGHAITSNGYDLVYGGSNIGLMGVVADTVMENGGHVIGVIPRSIADLGVAHNGLNDLRVVGSMHERKAIMADLSDAFVVLPGGIGTFEELFEIWTWGQLDYHEKPIALLNVDGFFDPLTAFLDQVTSEGFMKPAHRAMPFVSDTPDAIFDAFRAYVAPKVLKVGTG